MRPGWISFFHFFFALFLTLCAPGNLRAEALPRSFALSPASELRLEVPTGWRHSERPGAGAQAATITLNPPAGGSPFEVLLTAIARTGAGRSAPEAAELRAMVENVLARVRPQALEQDIAILALQSAHGPGFYFSATDRAPAPGEFKRMTQGLLRSGELILAFTVLTNEDGETTVAQALAMLRSATQQPRLSP